MTFWPSSNAMSPLAPLHQPNNLAPIRSILARLPGPASGRLLRHRVSSRSQRDRRSLCDPGASLSRRVRRYGFHGLSYEYVAGRLPQVAPEIAGGQVIVAHLGSGASMCALSGRPQHRKHDGIHGTRRPADGHAARPDRSRRGALSDSEKGMSAAAVQDLLYHECGLKGLSGISNDMRELEASYDLRHWRSTISSIGSAFAPAAGGGARRARCLRVYRRDRRELRHDPRARIVEKLSGWAARSIRPRMRRGPP